MEVIIGGKGAPTPEKRPSLPVRLLVFLVTVCLVLAAVALVAFREQINFDAVRRWYAYRDLERSESGQAESFAVDIGLADLCAAVGSDLLLCSSRAGVRLYSDSGTLYVNRAAALERPVGAACGKYAVVYDAGGQDLYLYTEREEIFTLSLPQTQSLISAAVNQHGWLAVVRQESGTRGVIAVYNGSHRPVAEVRLSSRFVMDAAVSPDNRSVAVLTIGLTGGSFECRVDLYRLDGGGDGPDWSCSLDNNTVLGLRWDSDGIWALGESALSLVSPTGTVAGSYSYGGRYLKDFSLDGENGAVLLLGKYRAGSSSELSTVSPDGSVRASLALEEQVLSLSAAGRYVAVLTADRLDVYNLDLKLYASLEGTRGARQVLLRDDGTALLVGADSARLFIP